MNNNYEVERWVQQARGEAFEVKECLARVGIHMWIEAFIVLTQISLTGPIQKGAVTVIEVEDLKDSILRRKAKSLSHAEIARAVAAIYRGKQRVRVGA